jgi:hypothetical protein
MVDGRSVKCPNCSAPMLVALGETDVDCGYCDSLVRFLPGSEELEVVRTREELKHRERVALQQTRMRHELEQEEAERWRQTAAKVAIAALPIVGRSAGRVAFEAVLGRRTRGCLGCGCVLPLAIVSGSLVVLVATALR